MNLPPEERTPQEEEFLMYYYKFLPVIDSQCLMNKVCYYIEDVDFHIKQRVRTTSEFDYRVLLSPNFTMDFEEYNRLKEVVERTFKEWGEKTKAKQVSKVERSVTEGNVQAKFERTVECSLLKQKLEDVVPNEQKLTNYLIYMFYSDRPSFSKANLWALVGKQIYENVRTKHLAYNFPIKDENGSLTFLYEKYQVTNLPILTEEDYKQQTSTEQLISADSEEPEVIPEQNSNNEEDKEEIEQ